MTIEVYTDSLARIARAIKKFTICFRTGLRSLRNVSSCYFAQFTHELIQSRRYCRSYLILMLVNNEALASEEQALTSKELCIAFRRLLITRY